MAKSGKRAGSPPAPLILDSGAVIALSRSDARARAFLRTAIDEGAEVFVPAVVIAETIRGSGPRDAPVNRVLQAASATLVADEEGARAAGGLLGSARSEGTIDALVVAAALQVGGGHILTSDIRDFQRLARGARAIVLHGI